MIFIFKKDVSHPNHKTALYLLLEKTCVCAHLGYLVVHAFYYNLPFSFLDSATLVYCAIDLIADLNSEHKDFNAIL